VQDNLLLHSTDVVTLILENSAEVFVCGDANNMAKDVKQAFVKAIETEKGKLKALINFIDVFVSVV